MAKTKTDLKLLLSAKAACACMPETVQQTLLLSDAEFIAFRDSIPETIKQEHWVPSLELATEMMEMQLELEPSSALKEAGSSNGIPWGDPMGDFVEWARKEMAA